MTSSSRHNNGERMNKLHEKFEELSRIPPGTIEIGGQLFVKLTDHNRAKKLLAAEIEKGRTSEIGAGIMREALLTIERSGAPGGAICARRADGHSCSWCRGMLTPCPVLTARKALEKI